ncbi:MAG: hypothetical protein L0154_06880 [Chloroflexi bacterium]|nr:hypothetical protein [Chloroflexota bacterium]
MKMDVLFEFMYEEFGYKSPENPHIVYPVIEGGAFAPYLKQLFGTWLEESNYLSWAEDNLGATQLTCNPQNVTEYLDLLDLLGNRATPLSITGNRLTRSFGLLLGKYALVISDGSLDDLFLTHALRWSDKFMGDSQHTIVIPDSVLNEESDYQALATWCDSNVGGNTFELISYSLPLKRLVEIRDIVKRFLPPLKSVWAIDIVRCNAIADVPDVVHSTTPQVVNVNDVLSFEIPKPNYAKRLARNPFNYKRWICDINLSPGFGNKQAFLPSMFEGLDLLLSGQPDRRYLTGGIGSRRIARSKLAITADFKHTLWRMKLPSHKEVIEMMCSNAGYATTSNDSLYYDGILKLLGQLRDANFLQNDDIRDLFLNRDFIRGKAFTLKQMFNRCRVLHDQRPEFKKWIEVLAGKQIFLQGYNLKCPICGLDIWYSLARVDSHMECEGCRSTYQIPIALHFAYRLNHLFQDGQNQGVVTEILTLLLLENTAQHGFIWQANKKLSKGETDLEIDIIAMLDGYLVVAECKNSLLTERQNDDPDERSRQIEKLKKQIDQEIEFAVDAQAHLYLYAVLNGSIPQEIIDHLDNKRNQHPDLVIRIVTQDELIRCKFQPDEQESNRPVQMHDLVGDAMLPPYYEGEDCFLRDNSANERVSTFGSMLTRRVIRN